MSTIAYAALTNRREEAPPGTSTTAAAPGVTSYVDAVAALVPAEVLTLHALVVSATTRTEAATVRIVDQGTLAWAFLGLLLMAAAFYLVPRWSHPWDRWDWLRAAVPPLSFVAWTMLQKATAFDAVAGQLGLGITDAARNVIALFLAAGLGGLASLLAMRADAKPPGG